MPDDEQITAAAQPAADARGAAWQPVRRPLWRRLGDQGAATAEYAVVMIVACSFAGLLLALLTSSTVKTMLTGLIKRALSVA